MGRLNEVVLTGIVDEENRRLVRVSANGLTANIPVMNKEGTGLINPVTGDSVDGGGNSQVMNLQTYPGVKTGVLSDNTEREANSIAINIALSVAASAGLHVIAPAATYELYGKINVFGGQKLTCDGIKTKFVQYQDNTAVIHFGAGIGSGTSSSNIQVDGGWYYHINDQTGNTQARVWEFTGVWRSSFTNFILGNFYDPVATARMCNYGMWFDNGAAVIPGFNNTFKNFNIRYFDTYAIWHSKAGTGSSFDQAYIQNGDATKRWPALGAYYAKDGSGTHFGVLNIEWASLVNPIHLDTVQCFSIDSLHVEEVELRNVTGTANRGIVYLTAASQFACTSFDVYNGRYLASNNLVNASIFMVADSCYIDVDMLRLENAAVTGTNYHVVQSVDNVTGSQNPFININNIRSAGTGRPVAWDNLTLATASTSRFKYERLGMYRNAREELATLSDAAQTIYAGNHPQELNCAPTVARTWTLSGVTSATTATIIPPGTIYWITCAAGSAGSLTVNGNTGSLIKSVTAGTWLKVQWDGAAWVSRGSGSI